MPSRKGAHGGSRAGHGRSLPELALLLLVLLALLAGSVLPLEAASSPNTSDEKRHGHAEHKHNATKAFPVLSLEYGHVKIPFEISLWVLLASLMKLGECREIIAHRPVLSPGSS